MSKNKQVKKKKISFKYYIKQYSPGMPFDDQGYIFFSYVQTPMFHIKLHILTGMPCSVSIYRVQVMRKKIIGFLTMFYQQAMTFQS